MLKYIVLSAYCILSILDLYFIKSLRYKRRIFTKSLLMPLLMLFLLFQTGVSYPLAIAALAFATMGDVFLLAKQKLRLVLGIASFLLCQLLYTIQFALFMDWQRVDPLFLLFAALYIALAVFAYSRYKLKEPKLKIAVIIYIAALSCMSFFALLRLLASPQTNSVLMFAGSLFFLCSDAVLAHEMFAGGYKHSKLLVMATYTVAQLLIVLGFAAKQA